MALREGQCRSGSGKVAKVKGFMAPYEMSRRGWIPRVEWLHLVRFGPVWIRLI